MEICSLNCSADVRTALYSREGNAEPGLFVGATRLSGTETGMFYFYAGTHPETYGEVFDEFDREIGRIQDGG